MKEIWGALGAIAALVAVGVAVAQLGGRRGIQRKVIREDLELLKLLDGNEHAPVLARLRARFVVLAAIAVVIINVFDVTGLWVNLLLGGALGLAGNVVLWIVMSRREKAEQDQAVAEVKVEGELPRMGASFSMTMDPQDNAGSGDGRGA
jgi:hypothetical protein